MDIFLMVVACILLLAGLVGCVVPALPGPPLCYVGLLFAHFAGDGLSTKVLLIWLVVTILVTIMDYYLPVLMTRKFGGSRPATIGSALGLIAGILSTSPILMVVFPFVGAFIGQLIYTKGEDLAGAVTVSMGSFFAFILGVGAKLVVAVWMVVVAVKAMFF